MRQLLPLLPYINAVIWHFTSRLKTNTGQFAFFVKMYATVSLVLVALLAGTTKANPIDFPPLGGWSEIGTNDQDVQEAAAFAASELNLNLVDVISAQSQVRFSLFNVNK